MDELIDSDLEPQEQGKVSDSDTAMIDDDPVPLDPGTSSAGLTVEQPASTLEAAKSMENILLETSTMEESIDLGNSTLIDQDAKDLLSDSEEDIFASLASEQTEQINIGEQTEGKTPMDNNATSPDPTDNKVSLEGDNMEGQTEGSTGGDIEVTSSDISQYFQETSENNDIFASLTEQLTLNEDPAEREEDLSTTEKKVEKKVRVHLESHSSLSAEEPTTVDFEEEKGELSLKPTPSTRSLARYFSTEGEANDEAKSFFDTFTVGEGETSLSNSGFPSLETSISDPTMKVPETPPIPVGSPMPSPFHHLSAPASATEQSTFFQEEKQPSPTVTQASRSPPQAQFQVTHNEDPFTFGLNISDIDRRHDAWIPSEITRQVLITLMTSPPGSVTLHQEQMTMPGLIHDDPMGDPVRELVHRYVGELESQKRNCLTADSVAQDETGLRKLIKAECWRSAIDLSGRLLTQCGQGLEKVDTATKHTPYTLQLWFCRLSLLIKLRLHSEAEAECEAFGNMDKPDLYYEYYQDKYPGRRGSMVPFGLRVLHALLPHHLGKTQESLDRIYYLHAIVCKIVSNLESGLTEDGSMLTLSDDSRKASRDLWETREIQLLYCVADCVFAIKDYNTTLSIFEELLSKDKENQARLLCTMARIYLQMGDTISGKKFFHQAEALSDMSDTQAKCQHATNLGFLSLGQNQFQEAYNNFKQAVTLDSSNATALNNMAVCALYTGNLNDALNILETLVDSDPDLYLQEGILFNLCTLFELESSHAIFKKQKLLSMVNKHKGNGFNVASLKMS